MKPPLQHGRLTSLQQLRGAAALSVLLYHLLRLTGRDIPAMACGVDVFFVVSGFILWTRTRSATPTPGAFLRARAIRILPLYWLLTIGVAGAALLLPHRFASVHPTLWHVMASLALIPHFNPAGQPFPILPLGWTLSYEAVFYLLLGCTLRLAPPDRLTVLSAGLICLPLIGLVWHGLYELIANPMLLEFAAGVWLAEARLAGRWRRGRFGGLLAAAGIAIVASLQLAGGFPDLLRPLLWGPAAALIVAGWVILEDGGVLPQLRPLTGLGEASYSIYLTHDLVLGAVLWTLPRGAPTPVLIVCGLVAALTAGWFCWIFVERPMTAALTPRRASGGPIPIPLARG